QLRRPGHPGGEFVVSNFQVHEKRLRGVPRAVARGRCEMIGGNRVGPRIGAFSATAAAILAFGSMAVACAPTHVVSSSDSLAKRVAQLESRQEKLVDELASLRRRVGGLTRTDAPLATGTLFGIDALPSLGTASRWHCAGADHERRIIRNPGNSSI